MCCCGALSMLHRFKAENILVLELDLPERTTFDLSAGMDRAQIQARSAACLCCLLPPTCLACPGFCCWQQRQPSGHCTCESALPLLLQAILDSSVPPQGPRQVFFNPATAQTTHLEPVLV